MKLYLYLMIVGLIPVHASLYSQNANMSIHVANLPMRDALKQIEQASGLHFFMSDNLAVMDELITVDVQNENFDYVMNSVLKGRGLSYKIFENNVVVITESTVFLQGITITGIITDNGEPMPGVNVMVKGTLNGVVTDVNGKYSIIVSDKNAILVFSFVGYVTNEFIVGDQTVIDLEMDEDTREIEEVVVVGYGTQKKVNLTGSVTAINSKEIESIRATQPSQLLAGMASGITVTQGSGQPGKDNASLRIRGIGTFSSAGTSPLVLIDGISSDLDQINVNDIESISILKDAASAAIYGTRAANGVILVETKKGKEGISKITYQGNFGFQRPAVTPKIVDSWVYAEMINEALRNGGGNQQYTEAEIAKFKSGEDQDNYPNKRHYDDLITSGNGFQSDHYLSFTGGTAKNSYLLSIGYLDQKGFIAETYHKHYNALFNISSKITENFRLNAKFSGRNGETNEPISIRGPEGVDGLLDYAIKIPNTIAGKKSDGYYGQQTGFTIEGWLDSESFSRSASNRANASAGFDWNIFKSLKLTGLAGYNYNSIKSKRYWPTLIVDQNYTESPSELSETRSEDALLTLQAFVNYDKTFSIHEIHFLGGFSQESYQNSWLQASRDNFPSNTLYEMNAGAPANQKNSGSGYEWVLKSFFSRFNYILNGKYLFEANARYDASSRFPKKNRWGLFPSISAGWIISQEDFFKASWINHLKIRASWGSLGNQNIGNYPYQQVMTLGVNAPFGVTEKLYSGAAATVVPSADITWESTRVIDAGLDVGLFNNKINLSVDYYDKLTSDILYNVTASAVLGMTPSIQNAGVVSNKGIDFNIQHRNTIGDFSYSIAANFSYVKNKVKELATVKQDVSAGLFVGYPLQSIYGYVAEGLFVNQQDVDNYAQQPRTAKPGDIKLKDIGGPDGVPDNIVNADFDREIIGNQFPKYTYGLTISPRYKNFDLFISMYGVAGVNKILGGFANNAFYWGSNPQQWMVDGRWTEGNPNPDAIYPRFLIVGGGEQQFYNSTYVMQNASFLRISNIQLGCNVPLKLIEKVKMSGLYVYAGVKNPFTIDRFREGWDPEMGAGYPPVRYFNAGLNVNF